MAYWNEEDVKLFLFLLFFLLSFFFFSSTWVWTTMAYWNEEDVKLFLKKRLCKDCKAKGVERIGFFLFLTFFFCLVPFLFLREVTSNCLEKAPVYTFFFLFLVPVLFLRESTSNC